MNLTLQNGIPVSVDRKKIHELGPHISGGSFIKVNGHSYLVKETIEEILKLKKEDPIILAAALEYVSLPEKC